jgi:hypothetical protein
MGITGVAGAGAVDYITTLAAFYPVAVRAANDGVVPCSAVDVKAIAVAF